LQYNDHQAKLVGYGWAWDELGIRSAAIYGTTEAFKQSAIALWKLEPAGQLALTTVPPTVVEVEFENPWDARDFDRTLSDEFRSELAFEKRNTDKTPWVELHKTDGRFLKLGYDIDLGGDLWTRNMKPAPSLEGLLGFSLPSMEEVKTSNNEIPWVLEKVPHAMSMQDYEMLCRITMAYEKIRRLEKEWLSFEHADLELGKLLRITASYSCGGVSALGARMMEEPSGAVEHSDVPRAGHEMVATYPELATLEPEQRGEYALSFYGKNGIRHEAKHRDRDPEFMEYAILRNLGIDVSVTHWDEYAVVFRLLRTTSGAEWEDAAQMARLAKDARKVCLALAWANDRLSDLDQSCKASRLVTLGLAKLPAENTHAFS
jgi:hypothetical protein